MMMTSMITMVMKMLEEVGGMKRNVSNTDMEMLRVSILLIRRYFRNLQ